MRQEPGGDKLLGCPAVNYQMMTLIAKVEKSCTLPQVIPGCGCAIDIKFLTQDARLRAKDPIQLRTPDGQVRDTYVAGFERAKRLLLYGGGCTLLVCLPRDFTEQDVPPGTEIWSAKD